jgi:hypothetical protein
MIMPLGILFWVIMILWLVFGVWQNRAEIQGGKFIVVGGTLLQFILFFLLGWKVFGFIVQG